MFSRSKYRTDLWEMFLKLLRFSIIESTTITTPMINRLGVRFQSTDQQKVNNSNLYRLRKATGYALSKCKEALEKMNGDIEKVFFTFAYEKIASFYSSSKNYRQQNI